MKQLLFVFALMVACSDKPSRDCCLQTAECIQPMRGPYIVVSDGLRYTIRKHSDSYNMRQFIHRADYSTLPSSFYFFDYVTTTYPDSCAAKKDFFEYLRLHTQEKNEERIEYAKSENFKPL